MKKISLLLLTCCLFAVTGCRNATDAEVSSKTEQTSDNGSTHEHIDYYKKSNNRLVQQYQGKSFWTDGIEQVTLRTCIDGDTAHFDTSNGDILKARFFGIDTPESTGAVEEWGKEASNYTKEKLKAAQKNGTIVISSPFDEYKAPEADSTGSRYVSLVWINTEKKNAPISELDLLNLMIVQEGLSYVKNVADMPRMQDDFLAAEAQARVEKLNMFSGQPSSLFNYGSYQDTSLLDIKKELELSLADSSHENKYNNQKVRIVGTVAGYSNNILYIQNFYSKEQGGRYSYGEYAGINIFTGMTAIPSKYSAVNTYIQVCGLLQDSENFGFQMTDAQFKPYPKDDDDKNARVLISAKDNTEEFSLYSFEKKASSVTAADNEILNCSVKFTDTVTVTGGYTGSTPEITLYLQDESGKKLDYSIFLPFVYHPVDNPSTIYTKYEQFVGKKFHVEGVYTFHKSTNSIRYQIIPNNNSGFAEVK